MKLYAPEYYKDFSCIGGLCKHSCCIGWEIDIDKETETYYKSLNTDFGKEIIKNIAYDGDEPHFKTDSRDRCPFLNESNLCDIYTNLGEEHLCQICTDHPRFRNFYDTRTEIGLGLCCEEAARIILNQKDYFKLVCIGEAEEDESYDSDYDYDKSEDTENYDDLFFGFRENLINIVQNRNISFKDRINTLLEEYDIDLYGKSYEEWYNIFKSLEVLDKEWLCILEKLKNFKGEPFSDETISKKEEQLLIYFIFRHLSGGQYDGLYQERLGFCILSLMIIDILYAAGRPGEDSLIEISRMYSSEIEYCEENILKLLELI